MIFVLEKKNFIIKEASPECADFISLESHQCTESKHWRVGENGTINYDAIELTLAMVMSILLELLAKLVNRKIGLKN